MNNDSYLNHHSGAIIKVFNLARKIFFSFHYERDSWRVKHIRNSQKLLASYEETQFLDVISWDEVKRKGDNSIKGWIDDQLNDTICTVVLIGNQTYSRKWVRYEIIESWRRGNGVLGVFINNIKDENGTVDKPGKNPFNPIHFTARYGENYYPKIYNWVHDHGKSNISKWIEGAIKDRRDPY